MNWVDESTPERAVGASACVLGPSEAATTDCPETDVDTEGAADTAALGLSEAAAPDCPETEVDTEGADDTAAPSLSEAATPDCTGADLDTEDANDTDVLGLPEAATPDCTETDVETEGDDDTAALDLPEAAAPDVRNQDVALLSLCLAARGIRSRMIAETFLGAAHQTLRLPALDQIHSAFLAKTQHLVVGHFRHHRLPSLQQYVNKSIGIPA